VASGIAVNDAYTVELWNPDRIGTLYRTDMPSESAREALALALQDVKQQGVVLEDNVRMWVKVAGHDDIDAVAFHVRDIRSWLNEPEQSSFVDREKLQGV
jgi:hypothetical protein